MISYNAYSLRQHAAPPLKAIVEAEPAEKPSSKNNVSPANRERVLVVLERCARAGEVCPTNAELAHRSGLKHRTRASMAVVLLERDGFIKVEHLPPHSRVVTIVATGQSTARP